MAKSHCQHQWRTTPSITFFFVILESIIKLNKEPINRIFYPFVSTCVFTVPFLSVKTGLWHHHDNTFMHVSMNMSEKVFLWGS
jgi:uncharacterized membrane protein